MTDSIIVNGKRYQLVQDDDVVKPTPSAELSKVPMKKYGNITEVWNGEAECTRSGLYKNDLMLSRTNKPTSKRRSESSRAAMEKRLAAKMASVSLEDSVEKPEKSEKPVEKPQASKSKKNRKLNEIVERVKNDSDNSLE